MGYKEILTEIKDINYDDFTIESFRKAGRINRNINEIVTKQTDESQKEYSFYMIKNFLEDVVFNKLKEKLDFEDETVKKIVKYIPYAEGILEIYVLDGHLAVKVLDKDKDNVKTRFIPEDDFYDVTSISFNNSKGNKMLKKLIVDSFNNVFKVYLDENPLKYNDNGDILYSEPDFNIYLNTNFKELSKINNQMVDNVIKVIVKKNVDEIYYFDLKVRDGYTVIYQNEYGLNKVSELLNNKSNVKTR